MSNKVLGHDHIHNKMNAELVQTAHMFTHENKNVGVPQGMQNWYQEKAAGEREIFNKHFIEHPYELKFISGQATVKRVRRGGAMEDGHIVS